MGVEVINQEASLKGGARVTGAITQMDTGTVTQGISKSTAVTLNRRAGVITMNGAALAATTSVGFTVNNSRVSANDLIVANIAGGATADSYLLTVDDVAAGTFRLSLRNFSAGILSEAVVINFFVLDA